METGIDITVQKQALEALRKSHDELETRVQERTGEIKEVNRLLRAKMVEHKEARDREQQIAEEWQATFDSITDMVSIQDKDCRLVRVNKAYADAVGKKPEELIGQKCHSVIHGLECPIEHCPHVETINTLKPVTRELFETRLGLYLKVTTAPLYDENGDISGSVHIAEDITERKRAEEITERKQAEQLLAASQKHLERSQELAHLGSWELDLVNDRLTWSDEVYRIFGLRPQEFGATYEAFLDAVHTEDRKAVDAA